MVENGLMTPEELQLNMAKIMFQKDKKSEGQGFVIRYNYDDVRNCKDFGLYMSNNYFGGGKVYLDCFPKISNQDIEKDIDKKLMLHFSKNGVILVEPKAAVSYYDAGKVSSYGSYSTSNTIEEVVDYFGNELKTEMYQVMNISRIPLLAKKSGQLLSSEQITNLFNLGNIFENQTKYTSHETFYVVGKITPEKVISKEFLEINKEQEDLIFQNNFAVVQKGWEIIR
jgi:hypothetical protein